jgi:Eukaryotic aspartyl protease
MKIENLLVVGAILTSIGLAARHLEKRNDPAILKIPLQKLTPHAPMRKRQAVETPDLNYLNSLLYIVQLQVGTPPQPTYVKLDTGSSDLILETPNSNICSASPPNPCTIFGSC